MEGTPDPLAAYYPSVTPKDPAPPEEAFPAFRAFALKHAAEIISLGQTRYVQTNEVRRSALLLPAVGLAGRTGRIHLIDVGASAGLNLVLDQYGYDYGAGHRWGNPAARLQLTCEARGTPPPLPSALDVGRRVALDLHPVDAGNAPDRAWLRALIWPEHHERARRLDVALEVAADAEIEHVTGDALETLPLVLSAFPAGETAVVIHSFSLVQFTAAQRQVFTNILLKASESRPVWRIGLEIWGADKAWAEVRAATTPSHLAHPISLAEGHPHGEWIAWNGNALLESL